MLRLMRFVQMTVRLSGLALLILGVLIWTGNQQLIPAHMGLGLLFVLALWSLAALSFRSRTAVGLGVRASIWGIVVLWLGLVQRQVWPGPPHVYVRVLHLIVGLSAIGVAEMLGARLKAGIAGRGAGIG